MIINPKKKRRSSKRRRSSASALHSNPVRKRRRSRRRRNPSARAFGRAASFGGIDLMVGGVGATVAAIGASYGAKLLPASMQGVIGQLAVKAGSYFAASMLAGALVGKQAGKTVLFAGALIEGFQFVRDRVLPQLGLSGVGEYDLMPALSGYVADGAQGVGVYEENYQAAY